MAALNRRRLLTLILLWRRLRRRKYRKRFWVRQIYAERKEKGEYHTLVREAMLFDSDLFFRLFRMTPSKFEELLGFCAPRITRKKARREAIGPGERLSVTLRYLVTGDAFSTIAASYRLSCTSVGRIVKETCSVIWDVLSSEGFITVPKNPSEWKKIAQDFESRWNFPNCVGAIDGKHVAIQCPPRGGSMFFNYKKFHSIVLMAVCNAKYEFTMVDIGDYGRLSDGSVFSSSNIGIAMENNLINLPAARKLPGTDKLFPYVFVGDEAFPLKSYMVKPYPRGSIQMPERIANYRISRARRIIENAFGIATTRFRLFRRAITADVDVATEATKAVIILHNYLMAEKSFSNNAYCPPDFVDLEHNGTIREGAWRQENNCNSGFQDARSMGSNNYSVTAKVTRDNFRDYFISNAGAVPWQNDMVLATENTFDRL